jgi:16S rRNA (guanine527-N7)-methyltransferase
MQKLIDGARKLGLGLTPGQVESFESYYRELVAWNRKINLTAITGYDEVQVGHFLDSLTVLPVLPAAGQTPRVIDVGTGAGLPGLPLKIVRPEIRLTLLEATGKKASFLQHLIVVLGLDGIDIINNRAEAAAHLTNCRERFDAALSRAVAPLAALAELALPFCAVGGVLIAQKKGDIDVELAGASRAIEVLGGRLREVRVVDIKELGDRRCLVIIEKIGPTPGGYPRRPGIPAKRPIG